MLYWPRPRYIHDIFGKFTIYLWHIHVNAASVELANLSVELANCRHIADIFESFWIYRQYVGVFRLQWSYSVCISQCIHTNLCIYIDAKSFHSHTCIDRKTTLSHVNCKCPKRHWCILLMISKCIIHFISRYIHGGEEFCEYNWKLLQ